MICLFIRLYDICLKEIFLVIYLSYPSLYYDILRIWDLDSPLHRRWSYAAAFHPRVLDILSCVQGRCNCIIIIFACITFLHSRYWSKSHFVSVKPLFVCLTGFPPLGLSANQCMCYSMQMWYNPQCWFVSGHLFCGWISLHFETPMVLELRISTW